MADDVLLNAGTGGDTIGADDIGGIKYQRMKIIVGANNTNDGDVATGNPLPVSDAGGSLTVDGSVTADTELPAAAALGDTDANPTAPAVGAFGMYWNGAAWRRMRGDGGGLMAQGAQAHDAANAQNTNPVMGGGRASAAVPADVSADNDSVMAWYLRSGAAAIQETYAGVLAVAGNGASGTGVQRVTVANDSTGILAGVTTVTTLTGSGIAHDAADSGNPHKVGGRADTTFQTAVADGDRVDALFDVYGVLSVRGDHPNKWSYHDDDVSAVTTDGTVQSAPGAGLSVYITDIVFSIGVATASGLFIEEGSTKILGIYYLEAIAGRSFHVRFATPKKCTANTQILVTNTGAISFGIDIHGFIAP